MPAFSTHAAATSGALLRSTSTAAFMSTRSLVVSLADTAFSAGSSAGWLCENAALTAGMTLSAFCRCLSSSRTTSLSPGIGAHLLPDALPLLALLPPPVPDDPELPQAAVSATTARRGAMTVIRARMSARLLCPVRPRAATRVWREVSRTRHATPVGCARCTWGPCCCRFVIRRSSERHPRGHRFGLSRRRAGPRPQKGEAPRPGRHGPGEHHQQHLGEQRQGGDEE